MPKLGTFGSVRGVPGNGHSYRDQFFSGMQYYEPRLPCDATQIGRFGRVLGEAGVEQLLKSTIEAAVAMKAVKKAELERVIVDTTVQEKAISFPTDSRLLEVAREKIARLAKRAGLKLRQSCEREGRELRRKAGGYAHAKQTKRLRRTVRRQRTILGALLRDVQRKMLRLGQEARAALQVWIDRAERIRTQQTKDKHKLYALHAPEVECISKGKARQRYEFGVKSSLVITHRQGLAVGARSFPGNPFDGHTLAAQLEQTTTLLQDIGVAPKVVVVDLGYRGVDAAVAPVQLIHRGKIKRLTKLQRCWLKGADGDALHTVLCAAGYNLRWLLRAIDRLGIAPVFLYLQFLAALFAAWRATDPKPSAAMAPT